MGRRQAIPEVEIKKEKKTELLHRGKTPQKKEKFKILICGTKSRIHNEKKGRIRGKKTNKT